MCSSDLDATTTATTGQYTTSCGPGEFLITISGLTTPVNWIRLNWEGGLSQDVAVSSSSVPLPAGTFQYRTVSNLDKKLTNVSAVVPASWSGTLNAQRPCKTPPPVLTACLEGVVGVGATSGRFYYTTAQGIRNDAFLANTMTGGFTPPAVFAVDPLPTKFGPVTLAATPIVWSLAGTYADGKTFDTTTITLPTTGSLVTDANACTPPDQSRPT